MAKWNLDYYNGEDGYSEGPIEQELLELVKSTDNLDRVVENDGRWPVFYHFSYLRENIINWYPICNQDYVLEIGAGCGAITGALCKMAKKVVSVELTKSRSEINFERHKNINNLELITGNFHNIKFNKRFDYVILNGVFEYAASFTDSTDSYTFFLEEVKELLNQGGKILIAIENRLGLKYFNGAKEDHTGLFFSGLDNYENINFVKTFSKFQLKKIAEKVGFKGVRFYYPFYDYKFPEVIFTDQSFELMDFNAPIRAFDNDRLSFFDEKGLCRSLINENILDVFSNSFLLELSVEQEKKNQQIIYSKISNYRKKEFSILTQIVEKDNEKFVIKKGLNQESIRHVKKMHKNQNFHFGKIKNAVCEECPEGIKMPYINQKTFEQELIECLKDNECEEFKKRIKDFYQELLVNTNLKEISNDNSKFEKVFGNTKTGKPLHWKKNANVDLIFSNLFRNDEKDFIVIDYEWFFDFEIPVEFIIWRSLRIFILNNKIVQSKFTYFDLLDLIEINDSKLIACFEKWDDSFLNHYVGNLNLSNYEKMIFPITTQDLDNFIKSKKIREVLYIDSGNGFLENNCFVLETNLKNDNVSAQFNVATIPEIRKIRWDPCEEFCKIKDISVETNIGKVDFLPLNCDLKEEGWFYFLNCDPQFLIEGQLEGIKWVSINAKITKLQSSEMDRIIKLKFKEEEKKVNQLKIKLIDLENENKEIKESTIWKTSEPVRKVLDKMKRSK
ncbi:class I SAM-dependent methyltransferase [Eubacterium limosum]|uniref:class I SAM-dependent methyltransferase n=1 Tax=Eubacterium limosum TaxID=1736 RepID=UPI0022E8169D|nr:class I SAM-dependent methyltransferase [Eubacterium limosum]